MVRPAVRQARPLVISRRTLVVSAAVIAVAALAGCSPAGLEEDGQGLTGDQADKLAAARFLLYSGGPFIAEITSGDPDSAQHFESRLTMDPTQHIAWGTIQRGPSAMSVTEQIGLNGTSIARYDNGWTARPNEVPPAALLLVFSLASDRPENAQLLPQSTARYLGSTKLDGTTCSVFRLPSTESQGRSRLWLDQDGAIVRLDDGSDDLVIRVDKTASVKPMPHGLQVALHQ